ncbi:hypothetical protein IWW47_000422, partial [Coemansia sp. RSA 2052]
MAKLWYAARIVPFTDSFYKQVHTDVRQFIWKSKRSKVSWTIATLPKKQGGLGLLNLESQSTAIFAQFCAQVFRQRNSPWWAATAQWVMDQHLSKNRKHSSDLLAKSPPASWPKAIPEFWRRVLSSWKSVGGRGPGNDFEGPLESLLSLPFEHPAVSLLTQLPAKARNSIRSNKIFTLGDVFQRYEPTGAAITRDDPSVLPFVKYFVKRSINFHPRVVRKLLDYPSEPNRRAMWAHAQMGGVPLEAYKPRHGRLAMTPTGIAPLRLD